MLTSARKCIFQQPVAASMLIICGQPPLGVRTAELGHKSQLFTVLPPHCGSQHTIANPSVGSPHTEKAY